VRIVTEKAIGRKKYEIKREKMIARQYEPLIIGEITGKATATCTKEARREKTREREYATPVERGGRNGDSNGDKHMHCTSEGRGDSGKRIRTASEKNSSDK